MKKNVEILKQQADAEQILKQAAEIRAAIKEKELTALRGQLNAASNELNQFSAEKVQLSEALDKTQLQVKYLEIDAEYERLINEKKIERERQLRNIMLLSALSLVVVSFFIYRNYRQEKRSKRALADKNEQINKQNVELESLNRIIAKHNERMQSELNVGREIQMSMIPSVFPVMENVDLYALLEPALEVGGDLYDFFKLDNEHLFFGVGDVSDKGVPAALFMAVTKTLVKTHANYSTLPQKIMTQVNRELSRDNESSMFVTYFLCVLNINTGELSYCNAGHNPPIYLSKNHQYIMLDQLHGPVLGAMDDYEYQQDTLIMKKGDQIVLFTDGITEAMDEQNAQYSTERLCELFSHNGKNTSKEAVEAVIDDVIIFRQDADQSDDMTVLSLIYKS
jgi:sigma-B regulation protein RsbU (phosphoserine phosphatase)